MPTIITSTIRATGGDFTTLSAWEAAVQGDFVTLDQQHIAECYDDWPSGLDDAVNISGSTTSPTQNMVITSPIGQRHNGTPSTGFLIQRAVSYGTIIRVTDSNVRIEYLNIYNTGTSGDTTTVLGLGSFIVDSCTLRAGKTSIHDLRSGQSIRNSLIYSSPNGIRIRDYNSPSVYNCTIANCSIGVATQNNANPTIRNVVVFNCGTSWSGSFSGSSFNNAASNATTQTPPGTDPLLVDIVASDFIGDLTNDFHLSAGSQLRNTGLNLYGIFTNDIDASTRESLLAWDIGIDSFISVIPPSIVSDQIYISEAETTTGWSGGSFNLDGGVFVQGGNAVSVAQTVNGINDVSFTKASGSWDMSASHIRLYMNSNIMVNTQNELNNGIQMRLGDGTNIAFFTVGGSDTYAGGWRDILLDPNSVPASGSVNTSAITFVGIRINTTAEPINSINGWYDNWRYGNGLIINSGGVEEVSFQTVADQDALVNNAWNILRDIDGVLFGRGRLTLGSSAALNCNLKSLNEVIVFVDAVVAADLYAIVAQQTGSGLTDIDIEGLVCKTVGSSRAEFIMPSTVNSCRVVSSSFIGMGLMDFSKSGTVEGNSLTDVGLTNVGDGVTLLDSIWVLSAGVELNTSGVLNLCILRQSSAPVLTNNLNRVVNCEFTSAGTGHAVELSSVAASPMTWNSTATGYAGTDGSTGDETIFVNVGSGVLIINVESGATTPTVRTAGATVSIVTSFTLTLTDIPSGVNMTVVDSSSRVELQHTVSTGTDITFSHGGGDTVDILLMANTIDPNSSDIFDLTLPNASSAIKFQTTQDLNFENP